MTEQQPVFSVLQLNSLAKEMLETLTVWVEGEVAEFKGANSRYYYLYFTLKDTQGEASLPVVIPRHQYPRLGLELENGQKIMAQGKLSLFTKTGSYQFMINQVQATGQGLLAAQLEKLKQQLQKEGLLSQDRKRPLPRFPQHIGIVTSVASDAWVDFQRHSIDKYPLIHLTVADSFVQGQKAPTSIIKALKKLQKLPLDVIVLTRGGGSAEDLSAFNDEQVVRAIANSPIPTVVAVGHEKDISIADLVADVRASTPTNAGQIITRDYEDAEVHLTHLAARIRQLQRNQLESYLQRLDRYLTMLSQTKRRYQSLPQILQQLQTRLHLAARDRLSQPPQLAYLKKSLILHSSAHLQRQQQLLQANYRQLQAVSPRNVLARGYSIVRSNQRIVKHSHQVKQGDTISIQLHQGSIEGRVTTSSDQSSNTT